MKVLLVHNSYQQPGGEDQVFRSEGALLEEYGHEVLRYTDHNRRLEELNPLESAAATLWNRGSYRQVAALIQRERPDILHAHNTFPLISPAVYYAAQAAGVPVVQTLHNYRFLCPQSDFLRDGSVCEDCLGKTAPWPGVLHACYRGSRVASGGVAAMLTLHRLLGTYARRVDAYIALTEFGRRKFIEGGLPAEKLHVKPNFVHPDPGTGQGRGGFALYVGRLSPAKGIGTMLSAWEKMGDSVPLRIAGDGPLDSVVASRTERLRNVEWLGRRSRAEVLALMRDAAILVFPSEWYEGCPLVIGEAFASGLPVVASDLGAMATIIEDGRTGLHFRPRDADDLADKIGWVFSHPEEVRAMRGRARAEFEAKYTAERNYAQLMKIYRQAERGVSRP
ncbi:MAG TPA: glycosyltransferase family 4 protein [Gemmatimonadota bacterium]|nr:glycosyltransferase family 4 protein [Gemmatimonadota bacterium]